MDEMTLDGFDPRTSDKVGRLLDLPEEMGRHPRLKGRLALHGGTAINLFMLDVPRLSVDIDVSYIGAVGREEMLAERPGIEAGIDAVGRATGYVVEPSSPSHAGRTFRLRYRGDWGVDHVKIDCIYMNRSPIMAPVMRESALRPGTRVCTFSDEELVAGKVKALFDRVKVRDLYDVASIGRLLSGVDPARRSLYHRLMLYYASLSARFPRSLEDRASRFEGRGKELEEQLYPMLRIDDDLPTLGQLIARADEFIRDWVLPQTDEEARYVELFAQGDYRPALLFADASMAGAADSNPEALWKLKNLASMS